MTENDCRLLIVDDEPLTRKSLYEILRFEGYEVNTASDGQEALEVIEKFSPAIVIADLKMPHLDGLSLLREIKRKGLDIAMVFITGYGSIESAVEAMREGAFDYITKPVIDSEIKLIIRRILEQRRLLEENRFLRQRLANTSRTRFHNLIGANSEMQRIYNLIEIIAPTNATVLIQGESGTGKKLIAEAIHFSNPQRKDKSFIEVSCGALPESILESELFGHIKGAFTSAVRDRRGRFELADKGTIFLDEIDTFSPKLQVKLLRVLQEGEFERVGDMRTVKIDTRVIAATNRNLQDLIRKGEFREDLYYRLNVIPIKVPPLRERRDDIPLLVEHFLEDYNRRTSSSKRMSAEAMESLLGYSWPGNIRELENVIERVAILSKEDIISFQDLQGFFEEIKPRHKEPFTKQEESPDIIPLKEVVRYSEKRTIQQALEKFKGNRKKVAEVLGINRTTLYNKMREYGFI